MIVKLERIHQGRTNAGRPLGGHSGIMRAGPAEPSAGWSAARRARIVFSGVSGGERTSRRMPPTFTVQTRTRPHRSSSRVEEFTP